MSDRIIIETSKEYYKKNLEKVIENDDDLLDRIKYIKDIEGNTLKIIVDD